MVRSGCLQPTGMTAPSRANNTGRSIGAGALHRLAAGESSAGIEVAPVFAGWEVDGARSRTGFDDSGHQQRGAEHQVVVLAVAGGVFGEIVEGGAGDWFVVGPVAPEQRIDIGSEPVAELDQLADGSRWPRETSTARWRWSRRSRSGWRTGA